MATLPDKFQGVVCCCLDDSRLVRDTIYKLLDLKNLSGDEGLFDLCELKLKNKYYQATIHLVDIDSLPNDDKILKDRLLTESQAIILYGNGQKITVEQLDRRKTEYDNVAGEPRILVIDGIDEDCPSHKTLLGWSIQNGFDTINATDDDARDQVIDSLSAYKWTHRSETEPKNKQKLDDELMKKLVDFDSLLGKLSAYRDKPELRGNPNDENIMEIADLLSGLLDDDVDKFLEEGESSASPNKDGKHQ